MSNPQLTDTITHDHELDVLTQLHQNTGVKQRELAQAIGLSLGMTNAILKRLAGKGFVAMRRTVGHVVRYKERMLESLLGQAGLEFSRQTDVDSPAGGTKSDAFVIAGEAVSLHEAGGG